MSRSDHDAHAALEAAAERRAAIRAAWRPRPAAERHLPSLREMAMGEASALLPIFVLAASLAVLALAMAAGRVIRTDAEPAAAAASAASAPVQRVRLACQRGPDGRCPERRT